MLKRRMFDPKEFYPKGEIEFFPEGVLGKPFYFTSDSDGVVCGFITQGTTPILFLNWLKETGLTLKDRGYINLSYESRYNDYTEPQLSFRTIRRLAGRSVKEWRKFNKTCLWIQFEFEKFTVEWAKLGVGIGDRSSFKNDLAQILVCIDKPDDPAPGLQFLFDTLNNPNFMPSVAVPEIKLADNFTILQ